jgi:hypothetical protein
LFFFFVYSKIKKEKRRSRILMRGRGRIENHETGMRGKK